MKLGEIKIEALKLMFVNYNTPMEIEDIPKLEQEENYGSYLVNMPGSINRCFSSLEEKGALPSKSIKLENGEVDGKFVRYDLEAIEDFLAIDRLIYQNSNGDYNGNYDYQLESNILVMPIITAHESYRLLYKSKLQRITALTDNDTILPIPDNIASSIPYFIKGDLYRDDEPNEASEARNWYESSVDGQDKKQQNKAGSIDKIYSQTEI